jgi:hypothetical protein
MYLGRRGRKIQVVALATRQGAALSGNYDGTTTLCGPITEHHT